MPKFDYIISGGGASGLLLAYKMANDTYFGDKTILLIDKEKKSENDRTWCFWEKNDGFYDDILTKKWDNIIFKGVDIDINENIIPYTYKMIRSASFYKKLWEFIDTKPNITFIQDDVLSITQKENFAEVKGVKDSYHTPNLCNSIFFDYPHQNQSKYPVLQQHFIGYFIKLELPTFDESSATFMDFSIAQKGNTRFMYILPFSKTEALFEYTLFSENYLPEEEYKQAIVKYLAEKGIENYEITEVEKGSIPMTSYPFWKHNSENIVNIGTAGGWSKASSGYTFQNINKNTSKLISYLKTEQSLTAFQKKNRFWYYDLLLLDILYKKNQLGASIFSTMFKNISTQRIFKFLDEETSFPEELSIFIRMDKSLFMRALLGRIF